MEKKPIIKLYKVRHFSERFSAVIDFIRENWKVILKFFTYFMLPLSIIEGMFVDSVTSLSFNISSIGFANLPTSSILEYSSYVLISMVTSFLVGSMIFSMIQLYQKREERLKNLSFSELWPLMVHNIGRIFLAYIAIMLILIAVMLVVAGLGYLSLYTLFLTIPLCIVLFVPLMLIPAFTVFDQEGFGTTVSRSFVYGIKTWGGTFGFIFVMYLITNIASGITSTPWYVIFLFQRMIPVLHHSAVLDISSTGMSIGVYIAGIIMFYGSHLASCFIIIAMVFQYGHIKDKFENLSVDEEIENFDQPKEDSFI
jgi:hypothetical protein